MMIFGGKMQGYKTFFGFPDFPCFPIFPGFLAFVKYDPRKGSESHDMFLQETGTSSSSNCFSFMSHVVYNAIYTFKSLCVRVVINQR